MEISPMKLIIFIGISLNTSNLFEWQVNLERIYLWKPKIPIVRANRIDGLSSQSSNGSKISLIDSVQQVDWKDSFGKCRRSRMHEGVFNETSLVI